MIVLYPYPCYDEVGYEGTALYLVIIMKMVRDNLLVFEDRTFFLFLRIKLKLT